jgi:alkylated DNA repair dioxygenase AlkB
MPRLLKLETGSIGNLNMNPPPIHLDPNFVDAPDALFAWLKSNVHWDESMRARKTASFGVPYNYSQMTYDVLPMPRELDTLCGKVKSELGFRPNNCLLNYYPDGDSSMGFHSDSSEELAPGTGVAIVSVGCVRSIVYRSKTHRSVEYPFALPNGSLLFMSEEVQNDWLHAIPKSDVVGERISITLRTIVK